MNTTILELLNELAKHRRTKDEIIEEKIKERLNKSLLSYEYDLNNSAHYLYCRDSFNVLKRLTRKG